MYQRLGYDTMDSFDKGDGNGIVALGLEYR